MKKIVYLAVAALLLAYSYPAQAALTIGANNITTDGTLTVDGVAGSVYSLGPSTTTGTLTLGGTSQTGNLVIGQSSGTNKILLGTGSGATTISLNSGGSASSGVVIGGATMLSQGVINNPLYVVNANTASTLTLTGINASITSAASGALGDAAGIGVTLGIINNSSKTITNATGISVIASDSGDNTTGTSFTAGKFLTAIGSGMTNPVWTNMIGLQSQITSGSGSGIAVTNSYGLLVLSPSINTGTFNNVYGAYIQDQTSVGGTPTITNNYNLYSDGATSKNYFAGKVAIGTTAFATPFQVNVNTTYGPATVHLISTQTTAPTPSVTGAGYGSASMVTGSTDIKGGITATVAAAVGTLVVTFQTAYGSAPICTVSPATATAQVDVGKVYVTTGTGSALTLNFVATPTGGSETWNYICYQ